MEINFSNEKINKFKMYGGKNGNKIGIVLDGENYMLKFPPKPTKNPDMSYTNSCISEHISCRVFETLGLQSQKTMLGKYNDKVVVACKDFEVDGFLLKEFAHLKNTIIDSSGSGYGTELVDVLETIKNQQLISSEKLEKFFWEMFIGDTLLGNFDRHNGNWGFLVNADMDEAKIAPIFDCGSCLYPQLDDKGMVSVIENRTKLDERLFVFPASALKQDDVKINYFQFLMTTENKGCLATLKAVRDKIDLHRINAIIDDTPYISDTHKRFLKTMIKERKERIIDKAAERINGEKQRKQKEWSDDF